MRQSDWQFRRGVRRQRGGRHIYRSGLAGYTMMEVLIALVIFAFVMTGIYEVLTSGFETYISGQSKADIQQTARLTMEAMQSDLRMVGYGYFTDQAMPPTQFKITTATSTQITFWADLNNASSFLSASANSGASSVSVGNTSGYLNGDTIYLINGGQWETQTVQSIATPTLTLHSPLGRAYPQGTMVGRPRQVTYCWNSTTQNCPAVTPNPNQQNTIYRNEGDGNGAVPLISNVTAFTLSYFDTSDTALTAPITGSALGNIREIRAVFTVQDAGASRPSGFQNYSLIADVRPRNLYQVP